MKKTHLSMAGLLLIVFASAPQAANFQNSTGLTGAVITESFDTNAGYYSIAGNQFAGMSFGQGNYVTNDYNGAFPNMINSSISNFDINGSIQTQTSINFSSKLKSIAFSFVSNPGTTVFSAYLNNVLVESVAVATGYDGNFFGFTNILFNTLKIDSSNADNGAYLIDNLQTPSTVPVPAAVWLFGSALTGLLGFGKRKKSGFTVA
jgi:hypothetical protein